MERVGWSTGPLHTPREKGRSEGVDDPDRSGDSPYWTRLGEKRVDGESTKIGYRKGVPEKGIPKILAEYKWGFSGQSKSQRNLNVRTNRRKRYLYHVLIM